MTEPVAPGSSSLSFAPQQEASNKRSDRSFDTTLNNVNALAAPTTPEKRLPVVDRTRVAPEVLKAAEGMESLYLNYLMSVMRKTVPESEMSLNSPATKIYQGMMDSETAKTASRTGGAGLADQIIAYWISNGYNLKKDASGHPPANSIKASGTGGTHEGNKPIDDTSTDTVNGSKP